LFLTIVNPPNSTTINCLYLSNLSIQCAGQTIGSILTNVNWNNSFLCTDTLLPGATKEINVFVNVGNVGGTVQTSFNYSGTSVHFGLSLPWCPSGTSQADTPGQIITVTNPCYGLDFSRNWNYSDQVLPSNTTWTKIGSYTISNNCGNEDIKVTSLQISFLNFTPNAYPLNQIHNLTIVDGNSGITLGNVIANVSPSNVIFTGSQIVVSSSVTKIFDIYANVNPSFYGNIKTLVSYTGIGMQSAITYPVGMVASPAGQTITVPPVADFTVTTTDLCEGGYLHIINTSTISNGLLYLWDTPWAQGNLSGANVNQDIAYNQATTTYIKLTILDSISGNWLADKIVTIHVWAKPGNIQVSPSNPTLGCGNTPVTINISGTNSDMFIWKNGVGAVLTTTTSHNHTISNQGNYLVSIVNAHGCTLGYDYPISVGAPQKMNPVIYSNNTGYPLSPQTSVVDTLRICENENHDYQLLVGSTSYFSQTTAIWNNGTTGTTLLIHQSGKYFVTISNMDGCSETDTVYVIINPLPNAKITGDTVFCEGSSTTLTLNSGIGNTYFWNNGGMVTQSIQVNWTGMVYGNVINSFGCSKDAIPVYVQMIQKPDASITIWNDTALAVCHQFTGDTYKWYYYNNLINGATSGYYTANMSGWYKAEVMNSFGCSNISNPVHAYYNNTTGILSVAKDDENVIYPNPFNDKLNIKFSDKESHTIILYDISGKEILKNIGKNNIEIETSNLSSGTYTVLVTKGNETSMTKVIKK